MGNFDNFLNAGRSDYFRMESESYSNERLLLSSTLTDAINQKGGQWKYYIRTYDTNYNKILGEDKNPKFIRHFDFMGMYQAPESNDFFSQFGIDHNNDDILYLSKRHFEVASIDPNTNLGYIPKLGDVVESFATKFLYEITSIPKITDYSYYKSSNLLWEFTLKPFKDNYTDDENIDNTTLKNILSAPDIFDVRNVIDSKKEEILYNPKSSEQSSQNPFASW